MKVLWFTSWYPNKTAPFNGDFIKRHAEAVSLYAYVHVIHILRDAEGLVTKEVLVEDKKSGNLRETTIYYYIPKFAFGFYEKFLSARKYSKLIKDALGQAIEQEGKPDLLHIYIGMKSGIAGLYAKKKYGIKYIVTEQWTGLLFEATDNFVQKAVYLKMKWKAVLKGAAASVAVSGYLRKAIEKRFGVSSCIVIPNVVNTAIFTPARKIPDGSPKFIHISTFDEFKNPGLILQGFADFIKKNKAGELRIFTTITDTLVQQIKALGIEQYVFCHAEVPQTELVQFIQRADALILYSSYETFGCVVIEANACGLPVLVSDIPVMRELVKDELNGLLIEPGSAQKLSAGMERFVEIMDLFDRDRIARDTAAKFNYAVVGKQFFDLYQAVIPKS